MPSVTGLAPGYLTAAMQAYKSGARSDGMMGSALASVGEAALENIALYYALQCLVAFAVAHQLEGPGRGRRLACFGALTLLCVAVFLFGLPAE